MENKKTPQTRRSSLAISWQRTKLLSFKDSGRGSGRGRDSEPEQREGIPIHEDLTITHDAAAKKHDFPSEANKRGKDLKPNPGVNARGRSAGTNSLRGD